MITATAIKLVTARHFGLTLDELCGPTRARRIARPRQIAMALCRELTMLSLPQIGRQFGGKDHTTVLHAHRHVTSLRASNWAVSMTYDAIRAALIGEDKSAQCYSWYELGIALHALSVGLCETGNMPTFPSYNFLSFRDGLHALSLGLQRLNKPYDATLAFEQMVGIKPDPWRQTLPHSEPKPAPTRPSSSSIRCHNVSSAASAAPTGSQSPPACQPRGCQQFGEASI